MPVNTIDMFLVFLCWILVITSPVFLVLHVLNIKGENKNKIQIIAGVILYPLFLAGWYEFSFLIRNFTGFDISSLYLSGLLMFSSAWWLLFWLKKQIEGKHGA